MSIEKRVAALLRTECPRVFPDVAPISTERPYVTYQQIGGTAIQPLGREVPSKRNAFVQVNVWADTRAEASALSERIDAAFRLATTMQATPMAEPISTNDDDLRLRGTIQEFNVWADR